MFLVHLVTYTSQFICSIYIFKKLLNLSNPTKDSPWVDICFSILFSVVLAINEFAAPTLRVAFLTVLVFALGELYYKQRFNIGFATSVIAVGLNYVFYIIGLVLSYPLAFGVAEGTGVPMDDVEVMQFQRIVAGIIQITLVLLLFKIPRLKKGMPFLQRDNVKDAGILIGIILLGCTHFIGDKDMIQYAVGVVLACGMTLLVWWSNKLQASYKEKQNENQIITLEQQIEQARKERERIENLNSKLAKQLHEDRRIIPALYSQLQYITEIASFENVDAESEYRKSVEAISSFIQGQYKQAISFDDTLQFIPTTGLAGVNIMIRYMAAKAGAQDVAFSCVVEKSIDELTEFVSEYNLSLIVGDLIENALRAVKASKHKEILLKIHRVKDFYHAISVYDSGAAFSPETIRQLGLQPATSHPEDGGSGIGLMSIFEIVQASGGSYELDETIHDPPFTKAVTVRFDFKGQTIIKSHRDEIIDLHKQRRDMIIIRPLGDGREEFHYLDKE